MDESGRIVGRWLYLQGGEQTLASHHECKDVQIVLRRLGLHGDVAAGVLRFLQPVFTFDDLTDVCQMARNHPSTFAATRLEQTSCVAAGWLVKICHCSWRFFVKVAAVLPSANGDPWDRRFRIWYDVPPEMRERDHPGRGCPVCEAVGCEAPGARCTCDDEWPLRPGWLEIKARHVYDMTMPSYECETSDDDDEDKHKRKRKHQAHT